MKLTRSEVDLKIETKEDNMRLSKAQVEMLLELADKLDKQEILTKEEESYLRRPELYKK